MKDTEVVEIIKKAIILERQGQSFYHITSSKSENPFVSKIFSTMEAEEKIHEETLLKQLDYYLSNGIFNINDYPENPNEFAESVLTNDLLEEISGSGYEAAAISAAMGMEIRTIELYSKLSDEATDKAEKKFFRDLSDWEDTHLQFLSNLNRDILQRAISCF